MVEPGGSSLEEKGKVRVRGDFRILNKSIISDKFPLPSTEELFSQLETKNTLFAKLELETAYHQVPLAKACKPLTTIATHLGTFVYTRMPFGIKSAPSAFQRIMSELLHSCKGTLCYMDDILIAAKDKEELCGRIKAVRHVLDKANVQINEGKSTDESPEVGWLGYKLSAEVIKATKDKTGMFQVLRPSTVVREVRQILGVINYYGNFIPRLAIIA